MFVLARAAAPVGCPAQLQDLTQDLPASLQVGLFAVLNSIVGDASQAQAVKQANLGIADSASGGTARQAHLFAGGSGAAGQAKATKAGAAYGHDLWAQPHALLGACCASPGNPCAWPPLPLHGRHLGRCDANRGMAWPS